MNAEYVVMQIEEINEFCANSLIGRLGIEFMADGDDGLKARMPVNEHTRQPYGYLHGGATISLAETVASVLSARKAGENAASFGYHVDASLLLPVRDGFVYGTAVLAHEGRSSHIWDVTIKTESAEVVALCRVTVKLVNMVRK